MRMTRILILLSSAAVFLTACDPFNLVEPRPSDRRPIHPDARQQQPRPQPQFDAPRPDHDDAHGNAHDLSNQPSRGGGPVTERYPFAQRTEIPGQVISPYPPYNVIDVSDFQSGQLARDPSNNQIFRVP